MAGRKGNGPGYAPGGGFERLPGDFRIRLSSLEAAECRDDLLRDARQSPHAITCIFCLQSGSDRILRLMKRRYGVGTFLDRCDQIRKTLDEPAITTDVIVGFPGETEADSQATCAVARAAGFAKIHIFPYSRRHGTEAASFPNQVQPQVLAQRRDGLIALDRQLQDAYLRRLVGKRLDLLVEGQDPERPGWVRGTTCRKMTAMIEGGPGLIRKRVPIMPTAVVGDCLVATGVPEDDGMRSRYRKSLQLLTAS